MEKIIIGALAHVDAGKTSLSEALLFKTGTITKFGRVDHQDAFLDFHKGEQERGITIFNKEARFNYHNREYIYVDTPGHNELVHERNRVFNVLDVALLIIDGSDELPSDVIKTFITLEKYNIPIIIFINKMDVAHQNEDTIIKTLKDKLSNNICHQKDFVENIALNNEKLLNDYLENNLIPSENRYEALKNHEVIPCLFGSALKEEGIDNLLTFLDENVIYEVPTDDFNAYIYKITDLNGERLTHLKINGGSLLNKTSFNNEKINEILIINGVKTTAVQEVHARDLCAVKGLKTLEVGTYLPSLIKDHDTISTSLKYRLLCEKNSYDVYKEISSLASEFPELELTYDQVTSTIYLRLDGELHSQIIKNFIKERFNLEVSFSSPIIEYKETINEEVYGVGHFEPLRHYAEVIVKLIPSTGYKVSCLVDNNYSNSLISFLNNYHPKGILTNSELTNIEISIVDMKTHLKHTEGQDLFEALKRAIRQALSKTSNILLEPYYLTTIDTSEDNLNKIIAELVTYKLTYSILDNSIIVKIPEVNFNDIIISLKEKLKGKLSYSIENIVYDECHNSEEIIKTINYDYLTDINNPAGSIFTSNGAGHYVGIDEVEKMMHLKMPTNNNEIINNPKHNKSTINEEELKRVWNSIYKPKERYLPKKKNDEEDNHEEINLSYKPLIYLIDGYNLLHAHDDLNELAKSDFMNAREKTIALVEDFAGYVNAECVLVFDAYLAERTKAQVLKSNNITLIYTKAKEIADTYIEKKAEELKDDYKVIVVTSDRLEQLKVLSSSSTRLSSREFLMRYENMRKGATKLNKDFHTKPLAELRKLLLEDI